MNRNHYAKRVLSYIDCSHSMKKRLKEDILLTIDNQLDGSTEDINDVLGDPKSYALEIIDDQDLRLMPGFEFISSACIFGLPLVHITSKRNGFAKGIIAIGMRSLGVFSFGIMSMGLFSLGVISLGLIAAIGSLSMAGLFAIGAISVSAFLSIGAISVGNIAIGAIAFGRIALGDIARGQLALYKGIGSGDLAVSVYDDPKIIKDALNTYLNNQTLIEFLKSITEIM